MNSKGDMSLQSLVDLTKMQLVAQKWRKWTLMLDFLSTTLFPNVRLLDLKM